MGSLKKLKFILNGTELTYSPKGWDENLINRSFSETYFSLTEKYTAKLQFIKDGASILRNIYYTQGFEGICTLEVQQLQHLTQTYLTVFTGTVDFSKFADEREYVNVEAAEISFWENIRANENTEYEIDINSNNPIIINGYFPQLKCITTFTVDNTRYPSGYNTFAFTDLKSDIFNNEISVSAIGANPNLVTPFDTDLAFLTKNKNIYVNQINYKLDIWFSQEELDGLRIFICKADGTQIHQIADITSFSGEFTERFTRSSNFVVLTDEPLFLIVNPIPIANPTSYDTPNVIIYNDANQTSIFKINYYTEYSTTIKALTPITVFSQLLQKMNNNVYVPFDNTFLLTINNFLITSGDAIRGISTSKIKTNFKDFFESLNSIWGCKFGFENNKAILALKAHSFQNTEIINIGEVKDLIVKPDTTFIFNSLKIGYESQSYEAASGKYEFNSWQQWTLPIKKVIKECSFISKYRTDGIGALNIYIDYINNPTTDSNTDNDIFIFDTRFSISLNIAIFNDNILKAIVDYDSALYFETQPIINPINISLTPKRNLIRNLPFISSFLHNILGSKKIEFQTADKNSRISTRLWTELADVVDNLPIFLSTLPTPLFLPYIFKCKAVIPKELNTVINANTNGYITFTWKGETYKGHISNLGINPYYKSEYNLELRACKDTDLTNLIY